MGKPVLISIVLIGTALLVVPAARDAEHTHTLQKRDLPPPYQLADVTRSSSCVQPCESLF
jgi:hypothetical protein